MIWDWGLDLRIWIGDWDWGLGLGIGIGDWDWGLRIWDWGSGLGIGIRDWDWGLCSGNLGLYWVLGLGIKDWDWGLGIGIWNLELRLGIGDWGLGIRDPHKICQKRALTRSAIAKLKHSWGLSIVLVSNNPATYSVTHPNTHQPTRKVGLSQSWASI